MLLGPPPSPWRSAAASTDSVGERVGFLEVFDGLVGQLRARFEVLLGVAFAGRRLTTGGDGLISHDDVR